MSSYGYKCGRWWFYELRICEYRRSLCLPYSEFVQKITWHMSGKHVICSRFISLASAGTIDSYTMQYILTPFGVLAEAHMNVRQWTFCWRCQLHDKTRNHLFAFIPGFFFSIAPLPLLSPPSFVPSKINTFQRFLFDSQYILFALLLHFMIMYYDYSVFVRVPLPPQSYIVGEKSQFEFFPTCHPAKRQENRSNHKIVLWNRFKKSMRATQRTHNNKNTLIRVDMDELLLNKNEHFEWRLLVWR